jgi:3-phenylpropionate/trans-cinnamate dioxygenase ferredoxin reductase subunit
MTTDVIAIVGANMAGACAARALREEGFTGEIHLIGTEPHLPYERPPLSKELLVGTTDPVRIQIQSGPEWAEQQVTLRLSSTVVRIDPHSRQLELADGERLRADKVLLCTGGRPRRLALAGAELDGVVHLRTLDDSLAIRGRLRPGASVVVVGGGFIGTEVAASAVASGCAVTLVEAGDVLLWRALGHELGAILQRHHIEHGARVVTRTALQRIGGSTTVTHVVTATGERMDADLVVVGIGIVPAVELAEGAGLEVSNGIVVNEFCETSVEGIYAAGDVANHPNPFLGRRLRLEHWQNAQDQGVAAARSMLGARDGFRAIPWFWSDQYDLNVQMSGHAQPTDELVYRGDPSSSSFTAFYLDGGAISGVVGVNRPRDVRAVRKLLEDRRAVDPAQLTDENVDLRQIGPFNIARGRS